MTYYEYDFDLEAGEPRERLLALLSEHGFEGFEEDGDRLLAYIAAQRVQEDELADVFSGFPDLSFIRTELDDINWNQQWEKGFEPVVVEHFAAVRASFHAAVPEVKYDLVITPKMSFGTGHHPTTYLMIQEMERVDFMGKKVLDFGTGTGVLAILADKLGASQVLAIDNDEWSIRNAEENIQQNGAARTMVRLGDCPPSDANAFDVILANITRNVIAEHLQALMTVAASRSVWLFSGFLADDMEKMTALLETAGLTVQAVCQRGDWLMIRAER